MFDFGFCGMNIYIYFKNLFITVNLTVVKMSKRRRQEKRRVFLPMYQRAWKSWGPLAESSPSRFLAVELEVIPARTTTLAAGF